MADFCRQCAEEHGFPEKCWDDFKGITKQSEWEEGLACIVICEGCGNIQVDPEGNCASDDCLRRGHKDEWGIY